MKIHTKTLLTSLFTCTAVVAGTANATTLLDPTSAEGDFNDIDAGTSGFQTNWLNLNTIDGFSTSAIYQNLTQAGRPAGATNGVLRQDHRRTIGLDLSHTITASDEFSLSFYAMGNTSRIDLAGETGEDSTDLILYYTADDTIEGTVLETIVLNSGTFTDIDISFQFASATDQTFSLPGAVGKKLFVMIDKPTSDDIDEIVAVDYVSVEVVPEPGSLALLGIGGLCVLRRRRS